MIKRILLAGAAAATFALPAHADSIYNDDSRMGPLTGPYIGAYGAYGWTDTDTPVAGVEADPNGVDYGLYAGVRVDRLLDRTVNAMGMGLTGAVEFYYGWSNADDSAGGIDIEKDNEWGINFRPGLAFLDDTSPIGVNPYGIIGYKRAEFETSVGDEDFDGFELGIGTELVAYDNLGVRLEYSHTWYGDEGDFDPDEDTVRLGMSYNF